MDNYENIVSKICECPEIKSIFSDPEELMDLLDSMDEQELRIIVERKDPKILLNIQDDLNDTAKQLAMDE